MSDSRVATVLARAVSHGLKKNQKRKKRSHSESGSSDEESSLFRLGLGRHGSAQILTLATSKPGSLYESGVQEVARYSGGRLGPGATPQDAAGRMVACLTAIFVGRDPPGKVGQRPAVEMRTNAEALDLLASGQLSQLADLLMHRLKSLELHFQHGTRDLANHLELLQTCVELTSQNMMRAAQKAQKLEHALHKPPGQALRQGGMGKSRSPPPRQATPKASAAVLGKEEKLATLIGKARGKFLRELRKPRDRKKTEALLPGVKLGPHSRSRSRHKEERTPRGDFPLPCRESRRGERQRWCPC